MIVIIFFIVFLAVFSWLNPTHIFPWTSSHSEFSIFLSLIFLLIYQIINDKIYIKKLHLVFFSITTIPLLQFLFGKIYFFGDALISAIYIFALVLSVVLGFNIGRKPKIKEKFILVLVQIFVLCGLCSLYMQLTQWLMFSRFVVFIVELPLNSRPSANFAQPNILATFYIFSICSVMYLYEKRFLRGWIAILTFSFFTFGVTLTQSRTPWVYCFCFFIWFLWKGNSFNNLINLNKVILGMAIYIFFILIFPYIHDILMFESKKSFLDRISTGHERLGMWYQLSIAIKNEPWFGYGWNQVSIAQVETTNEIPFYVWTEHSHNIILDLFIWNGIPLGLIIIVLISLWLLKIGRATYSVEVFWFLALVGAFLVHAMLEFPHEYAFFLIPVGLLLGVLDSEYEVDRVFTIQKGFCIFIVVLLLSIYAIIFYEYRKIESKIEVARYKDLKIGFYHEKYSADIFLLTQLDARLKLIEFKPNSNMDKEQLDWMRKVAYRYANLAALHRYTQCLILNGKIDEAQRQINIINILHRKKLTLEEVKMNNLLISD